MEFNMNRGSQAAARPAPSAPAVSSSNGGGKSSKFKNNPTWLRIILTALLFAGTVLLIALAFLLYFGGTKEANYVDKDKQQAVFLTNGQVYFGKIRDINKQYIDLQGIYYLNVNQQVQPDQKDAKTNTSASNSVSLVKLGCELHGPVDQMVINRDQVTFWENLKSDGQVTKAIAQWVQQNPNGQKCTTSSSSSDTSKP